MNFVCMHGTADFQWHCWCAPVSTETNCVFCRIHTCAGKMWCEWTKCYLWPTWLQWRHSQWDFTLTVFTVSILTTWFKPKRMLDFLRLLVVACSEDDHPQGQCLISHMSRFSVMQSHHVKRWLPWVKHEMRVDWDTPSPRLVRRMTLKVKGCMDFWHLILEKARVWTSGLYLWDVEAVNSELFILTWTLHRWTGAWLTRDFCCNKLIPVQSSLIQRRFLHHLLLHDKPQLLMG